ncbi:MAG: exodeoxyribonuclease subunit alpha [Rhizobacter sp.]|nr:exodeoxyribonuclease subunit alpha [Rhizobacter sp.]
MKHPGQFELFGNPQEADAILPIEKATPLPNAPEAEPLVDASPLDPAAMLRHLKSWSEQGWIRRLDAAFARFIEELAPGTTPSVLLSAAIVAHMEGRGHTCLAIDEWLAAPEELLAWPAEGLAALHSVLERLPPDRLLWLDEIADSSAVHGVAGDAAAAVAPDGQQPLVLEGSRLYLRRYWRYEADVAAQVAMRGGAHRPVDETAARQWLDRLFDSRSPVPTQSIAAPDPTAIQASTASLDWQKIACGLALRGRLSIITGGPGTGKTYTAARLLAALFATADDPQRLRVALAAPTGKAAARLKQSIDGALLDLEGRLGGELALRDLATHIGPARTLHSLLGARADTRRFRHDASHPLEVDVLVVDEASMVHLEMMAALLAALPPTARIILLGDKDQLASVEAGAVLADLCRDAEQGRYLESTRRYVQALSGQSLPDDFVDEAGSPLAQQTVMLRESRRFSGPIGQLALAVNRGDATAAAALLHDGEGDILRWIDATTSAAVVRLALQGRDGAVGGYRSYMELIRQGPSVDHTAWTRDILLAYERFRVLCAVREGDWGVAGLNRAIESALADAGLLRRPQQGEWYEGRPVMVTRNDYAVGVFNGDIGVVLRAPDSTSLRAYFLEGASVRSVRVSRLADVETAFAMTVHKSQGSEFEHTVVVLPDDGARTLTRELVYTGITRARQAFTLVSPGAASFSQALSRITRRSSGLPGLLNG